MNRGLSMLLLDHIYIYRVAHGIRTLFKDMPVTSATSKNMIAGMDRLAMEFSFNHQNFFVVYGILGLLT